MAACGNDGYNIFLFGGKYVSPSPVYYSTVAKYNVAADALTTEAWSLWQTSPSPPSSFEIEPHHYTQFNASYISAGAWKPAPVPLMSEINKFYATFATHSTNTGADTFYGGATSLYLGNRYCTYIYNDLLYFIGGTVGHPHYATVDAKTIGAEVTLGTVYDGQPNIYRHSCIIYNTDVYVFGGKEFSTFAENLPVHKCSADYTVCNNITGSGYKNIGSFSQAVVVDELIFVSGGIHNFGEITPAYSNYIKIWDPSTDTWLAREMIFTFRNKFHVQWLHNLKKLVIIGGTTEDSFIADDSIYIYSFREVTPSPTTTLSTTSIPTTSRPTTDNPTNDHEPSMTPTILYVQQKYVFIDNATDWFSAQKYCQRVYHSNLATIIQTVDFDNINIYSNISSNRWIGLNNYYQNTWQWI
eukprot:184898_1